MNHLGRWVLVLVPNLLACDSDEGKSPVDGRIVVVSDEAELAEELTEKDEPVEIQLPPSPSGRVVAGNIDFSLTLVAQVAPPEVDGVALQATSVAFSDSVAIVGYNVAGDQRRGAVDVFVFNADRIPSLTSRATFADTDVNAVAATGDLVLLATATDAPGFESPAVLEALTLGPGHVLSLTGHFRAGLSSFAATSVATGDGRIYATSGARGDLFAFDEAGAQLHRSPLDDARWVTVKGDGSVVVVRGTPGALSVYDGATLEVRAEHAIDGASIAESKSTVEVLGGKAFVAGGPTGALVIDLASGLELARIPIPTTANPSPDEVTNAVSVDGMLVFVSNGAAGVFLIAADRDLAVATPGTPTFEIRGRLAFAGDGGSVNHITYKDGFLFVASGRGGLKIVRVDEHCVPSPEIDGNGIDDDCDGVTDPPPPPPPLPLVTTVAGPGRVASVGAAAGDIDCGSDCTASYPPGTSVSLVATADPDGIFQGWGGACVSVAQCVPACEVTMSAATEASASFILEADVANVEARETYDDRSQVSGSGTPFVVMVPTGSSVAVPIPGDPSFSGTGKANDLQAIGHTMFNHWQTLDIGTFRVCYQGNANRNGGQAGDQVPTSNEYNLGRNATFKGVWDMTNQINFNAGKPRACHELAQANRLAGVGPRSGDATRALSITSDGSCNTLRFQADSRGQNQTAGQPASYSPQLVVRPFASYSQFPLGLTWSASPGQ